MRVEKELVVNAPVDRVYELWTDFERFPRFMHHVESVTQTGDDSYHWKAKLGGRDVEWNARVVGMVPNRSVTWRSTSGAENAGAVNLAEQGNVTLMQVVIEYEPNWFAGLLASVTGEMARSVEEDLDRFKRLAEGVAGPEPTRQERMNADKGTDVGKETRARLENQPSGVQGATSQSVGPGNTGAYGPSAARAGLEPGGVPSESATPSADQAADSTTTYRADSTNTMPPPTPPPAWARSGQMQGGHEGGGEYASGGASAGSLGGSTRSGSEGAPSPVPGEEIVDSAAAGTGGAGEHLPGQAGDRAGDSTDYSARSGERQHGTGYPANDETAGTDRPVAVSGSHHDYGGTDITPTPGATGFAATESRGAQEAAGTPPEPNRLETGDQPEARAMDSGSPRGQDSTTGGGSTPAPNAGTPAATGGPGVSPAEGESSGAQGPSLYVNAAAGSTSNSPGMSGLSAMDAPGRVRPEDLEQPEGGPPAAPGAGTAGAQTRGPQPGTAAPAQAGSGVGTAPPSPARPTGPAPSPVAEEQGTAGLRGGTGGWGSPTGGEGAATAEGDYEAGAGVGGAATGDPGEGLGLPAASTTDLNTGQVPTGEGPAMGPDESEFGTTSHSAPGSWPT